MRWRFIDGGLPAPDLQIEVRADGVAGTDSTQAGMSTGSGAEFDGLEAHMTRQQLDADRDRHNWLTEQRLAAAALHRRRRLPPVGADGRHRRSGSSWSASLDDHGAVTTESGRAVVTAP